MQTIKRHASKQQETLAVIGLALAVVVLYAVWGASILNSQQEAATQSPASAVASR